MKDEGHTYLFQEMVLFAVKSFWSTGKSLKLRLNRQRFFFIHFNKIFLFCLAKHIKKKIFVIQFYTRWIYLDMNLHFVFFVMQTYQARREWNEPTGWTLSYITVQKSLSQWTTLQNSSLTEIAVHNSTCKLTHM